MLEKTVGVVGCGNIGSRVAHKWQRAVQCPHRRLRPYVPDLPFERKSRLEDLLPEADLLTLHVPLTGETRHLIAGGSWRE